jgi:sugar O-acyltransferase (sialic acid O-acetyltransferase NeuD family)
MTRIALLGAGDLGQTLAHHATTAGHDVCGFYDDTKLGQTIAGVPVLGGLADLPDSGPWDALVMGVGYRHLRFRQTLFESLVARGVPFATIIHPSATIDRSAVIAQGAAIFPGCVLDAHTQIGPNTLLNTGCIIAHDTHVGAHSFLGPGVTLAGFIRIHQRCFLGIGTVVIDNITIGDDTQTGGGTVVISDPPSGVLLVGSPARVVRPTR